MHYSESAYGFEYGAAKVERLFSDEKQGWVTIGVTTSKASIQVYVTKTGKVRVFSNGEWLPKQDNIESQNTANSESMQCPFLLVERFADNGAHSHWSLVNRETDEEEWSQQAGA